jgi:hypothetical protein
MLYIVSYVDYDGNHIQAEFDSREEAEREWEWANLYDFEYLTITEYETEE